VNSTIDSTIPVLIPSVNSAVQASAGAGHSLLLTNTSQVYSFGSNSVS
jgi:alpha-tubulin suppressor-like RCC1 family protein